MKASLTFKVESKKTSPIDVCYGQGETPVGKGVVFWDEESALCGIAFSAIVQAKLKAVQWGLNPVGQPDNVKSAHIFNDLFNINENAEKSFTLRFKATSFQSKVWQILSKVPCGNTWTYQELAQKADKEKAVRAVGSTMGKNPLSFILPCHRIVRSDGTLGHYGWGGQMKKKLLDWEATL